MNAASFDALGYFEKLKVAGFTEEQAKVQLEAMRGVVQSYDAESRRELATKGDIQDVRNELANAKHEILKWMVTALIAQSALLVAVFVFLR